TLLAALALGRLRIDAARAGSVIQRLHDRYAQAADLPDAPPELGRLAAAVSAREPDAYQAALDDLSSAVQEQRVARRHAELAARLAAVHPSLVEALTATPADPAWDDRLAALPEAWAWARAGGWLAGQDGAGGPGAEADLDAELDAAEEAFAAATADLAGALAWKHCLERMTGRQSAALRAFADAVSAAATVTGPYAERYRQAAREAMAVAQTAVPAWVMPLADVLATIPPVRDSFDVVIVDEASQAGLDSLFLLWLAPRVIVVGDDRQCTPADADRGELGGVFDRLDALLPDVPAWLRVAFTPRSSLFTLLRTRFGQVIRLREHFRCMPEIVGWSSALFYRDAPLLPLRQFGADRLPPLRAEHVTVASTEPTPDGPRNRAEADALVERVIACSVDPAYDGRSFGVVVLQGGAQADLIRTLLIRRMPATEQQRRRLRVGTPPDFQGDERDVVFLSLVVAPDATRPPLTRLEYQRRFNVAASRARDQVWLFHSVAPADLDPEDLRHNYLTYVQSAPDAVAPGQLDGGTGSAAGPADLVRPDVRHPRFTGLLEQRLYLALRAAGYAVQPGVPVNGRRIGLVVTGGTARLAVECDGDLPATGGPTSGDPTSGAT
ncbi:MAG: AAA domain-containing protein, partial [Frankia sp.]